MRAVGWEDDAIEMDEDKAVAGVEILVEEEFGSAADLEVKVNPLHSRSGGSGGSGGEVEISSMRISADEDCVEREAPRSSTVIGEHERSIVTPKRRSSFSVASLGSFGRAGQGVAALEGGAAGTVRQERRSSLGSLPWKPPLEGFQSSTPAGAITAKLQSSL